MKPLAALAAILLTLPGRAQISIRPQTFSLPNGMRVVLLEDHERPLIRARLNVLLSRDLETVHPGLAALALRVLGHSDAGAFSVDEFEQLLAGAGIELVPALRTDGLSWSLLARSRDQDLALGLLADRAFRSVATSLTLETDRLASWRETERLEAAPRAKLRLLLEPDWTLQAPTLEHLSAINHPDLLAFYARALRPDRAVLILQGDLGLEQAKRLVLLSFGTWVVQAPPPVPAATEAATQVPAQAAAAPAPAAASAPAPAAPQAPRILVRNPRPALMAMAVAAQPEDLDPESAALLALLLPGDPALAPAQLRLEGLDLVGELESDPSGSAASAETSMLERLQAIRQRGFTETDLRRAQAAWSESRALITLHPEAQVAEALADARGRSVSPARVNALTVEALNQGLRRWLDPARIRTGVLAGPVGP
ncbi:M16 family metallopeptidase [Geothrix mesophila]|uniref:M16 family metallopeptidase n=1 Tax=Geothrix mesophila TaxID=2922723 RepID=UPI002435419B|nr:insulinase family protein [Geothrix sp. SG198]